MGRKRREIVLDTPHHVAHRGNHRQALFTDEVDRRQYMALLHRNSRRSGTRIAGFCLMTNHVHVIAIPAGIHSISECFGRTHQQYSEHLNRRLGSGGTNWEGRFFCTPMSPRHAVNALRYLERNPVDAGLVDHAVEWDWSSARAHSGGPNAWPILNADVRGELADPRHWSDMLANPLEEEALQDVEWAVLLALRGARANAIARHAA